MDTTDIKTCSLCNTCYSPTNTNSLYAEAGQWLAEEIWRDSGELCPRCLENRAQLVMMYGHDCNT